MVISVPVASQLTNISNHAKLTEWLNQGNSVEIMALVVTEIVLFRGIPINLAAGLEDTLIARIQPPWNKQGVKG
jgi:hypothetical protein